MCGGNSTVGSNPTATATLKEALADLCTDAEVAGASVIRYLRCRILPTIRDLRRPPRRWPTKLRDGARCTEQLPFNRGQSQNLPTSARRREALKEPQRTDDHASVITVIASVLAFKSHSGQPDGLRAQPRRFLVPVGALLLGRSCRSGSAFAATANTSWCATDAGRPSAFDLRRG
jgi:hypothetical protein